MNYLITVCLILHSCLAFSQFDLPIQVLNKEKKVNKVTLYQYQLNSDTISLSDKTLQFDESKTDKTIVYNEDGSSVSHSDHFNMKGRFSSRHIYTKKGEYRIKDTLNISDKTLVNEVIQFNDSCTCMKYSFDKGKTTCKYFENGKMSKFLIIGANQDTLTYATYLYNDKGIQVSCHEIYDSMRQNRIFVNVLDSLGNHSSKYIVDSKGNFKKTHEYPHYEHNSEEIYYEYTEFKEDSKKTTAIVKTYFDEFGNKSKTYIQPDVNKNFWIINEYQYDYR